MWVDRARIEPAADWRERIDRGIAAAKALIFLITPESLASDECRRELDIALRHHKLVVPVLRREVERADLPDALSRPNWVYFREGDDAGPALSQLVDALETDLEWRDIHTRLAVRTTEWAAAHRDRSFLLRGNDLRSAEDWARHGASHPRTPPTPVQVEFIRASRKAADRATRSWHAALSVGLVIAVALGGLALSKEIQASHEARVANSNALAAEATVDLSTDPQESIALALRSTRLDASVPTEQSLRLALADTRLRMALRSAAGAATVAAWGPHQEEIALSAPGSVELWDAATGRLRQALTTNPRYPVSELLFDPSGGYLAAVSNFGYASIWKVPAAGPAVAVNTGALDATVRSLSGAPHPYNEVEGVWDVWAGPHASSRWWGGGTEELDLYGVPMRNAVRFDPVSEAVRPLFATSLPSDSSVSELTPSPSGAELFVEADVAQVIDFATDSQWTVPLPSAQFQGPTCWYPDSSLIVTSTTVSAGGPVDLWSPESRALVAHMQTPVGPTSAVACSAGPNQDWVAAGDAQGNLILRLATGSVVPLYGDSDQITDITSSFNGEFVATSSLDGTARVWDAGTGRLVALIAGDGAPINEVQFDGDGGLVLTVDSQGLVRVWDTDVGAPVANMDGPAHGDALALGFTDNGRSVYGLGFDHSPTSATDFSHASLLLWAAGSGRLSADVSLPGMALSVVPCSGYLKQMLGSAWLLPSAECTTPPPANLDATVALVHPTQFEQFEDAAPVALAVSGNGEYVAYGGAGRVEVIQLATRSVTDLPVAGGATGLSFGPRNELLVMSDKAVYLWQPTSGRQALAIAQPSPPIDAELSENGARLATANAGGTVQVWDAVDGRALATLRPPAGPPSAYFPMGPVRVALNGDGTVVASGDTYGQVCFWDVSTRRLVARQLLAANWPIVELQPAAGGSRLLAVDFPQAGSGVNAPPAAAVFDASTGREISAYSSPGPRLAPIDPGAALSPDGSFLLAGALGLSPTPPGGNEDAYQLSSGEVMAGLDGVTSAAPVSYSSLPAQPWSPDGTQVLIGNAIYECGACGSLTQLQAEATSRSDWSRPLSARDDRPPATNPYA